MRVISLLCFELVSFTLLLVHEVKFLLTNILVNFITYFVTLSY